MAVFEGSPLARGVTRFGWFGIARKGVTQAQIKGDGPVSLGKDDEIVAVHTFPAPSTGIGRGFRDPLFDTGRHSQQDDDHGDEVVTEMAE